MPAGRPKEAPRVYREPHEIQYPDNREIHFRVSEKQHKALYQMARQAGFRSVAHLAQDVVKNLARYA